jgi:hypothetical protein
VLSPFEADRSALADCTKLVAASGSERKAILIHGFDAPRHPVSVAIDAFEVLARSRVKLGPRCMAQFADLVHPVHQRGAVYGWEIGSLPPSADTR